MGYVIPADVIEQDGTEEPAIDEAVPMVAKLTNTPVDPERTQCLLEVVNLDEEHLTKPQQEQLKEFNLRCLNS